MQPRKDSTFASPDKTWARTLSRVLFSPIPFLICQRNQIEPGKPRLPEGHRRFRLCTSGGGVNGVDNNTVYLGSLVLPKTPQHCPGKALPGE